MVNAAIRFKQSPVRLHPGEQRTISLVLTRYASAGDADEVAADPGLLVSLWRARCLSRFRADGRG